MSSGFDAAMDSNICDGQRSASTSVERSCSEVNGSLVANENVDSLSKGKDLGNQKKKKEDKAIESMLKVLSILPSPEEKLTALCAKYSSLVEDHRLTQKTLKETQRTCNLAVKEKEHFEHENGKLILAKNRLENLCRELQKTNKEIKEESLQRLREQDEKRKEISDKFQTALTELHTAMATGKERSSRLHDENELLATKLQTLVEQYEAKDEHAKKLLQARELEVQLLEAKFTSASLQLQQLTEQSLKDKEQLLLQMTQKEERIQALITNELHLKQQVALYSDKYDEFQNSLKQSNGVFQTFKTEMDKMTKRLAKVDKETLQWKAKWEATNKSLIQSMEQKLVIEKEKLTLFNKLEKLESLCRALTEERSQLLKKLNEASEASSQESSGGLAVVGRAEVAQDSNVPSSSDSSVGGTNVEAKVPSPMELATAEISALFAEAGFGSKGSATHDDPNELGCKSEEGRNSDADTAVDVV